MIVLLCLVVHWMKFKFPSLGANHSLTIGSLEVVTSPRLEALSLSLVLKSSCRAWLWVSGNSRARSPPTIVTVPNMTRGRFCRSFACNVVGSMCTQELLPGITYSTKTLTFKTTLFSPNMTEYLTDAEFRQRARQANNIMHWSYWLSLFEGITAEAIDGYLRHSGSK